MKIRADIHLDGGNMSTDFDAAPWFAQASDNELLELRNVNWGGEQIADMVAYFVEDNEPEVATVLRASRMKHEQDNESGGFEVEVSEKQALAWLAEHKPLLHKAFDGEISCPCTAEEMNLWMWANPRPRQEIAEHLDALDLVEHLLKTYVADRDPEDNRFDHGLNEFMTLAGLLIVVAHETNSDTDPTWLMPILCQADEYLPLIDIDYEQGRVMARPELATTHDARMKLEELGNAEAKKS